ncbi:MAG: hypothetical protein RB191_20775 [Terriglobia bacterium]|nr:hypothetical protein [Terriglobia bacterium]
MNRRGFLCGVAALAITPAVMSAIPAPLLRTPPFRVVWPTLAQYAKTREYDMDAVAREILSVNRMYDPLFDRIPWRAA